MHGEAGVMNAIGVESKMAEIGQIYAEYGPKCVCNMEKTRLFHRLIPKHSHLRREKMGRR